MTTFWDRAAAVGGARSRCPPIWQSCAARLTGLVRLPLRVYASGQGPARGFDMSNEAERIELYEIVLTGGTAEDICRYVNREELLRLWPRLWLPRHVRQVWQPRLGVAAS
jgi:hypothetical protein